MPYGQEGDESPVKPGTGSRSPITIAGQYPHTNLPKIRKKFIVNPSIKVSRNLLLCTAPYTRLVIPSMNTPNPFFLNDAWAQEAGIELMEVSAGRAKVRLRIAGWHKNSHGTVHGGAIFTLADTAFALASNSHGIPAAAINAHIFYVKAATSGTLYAVAEEVSVNPKIATYTVTVTDDHGEKIALLQGMVYRKTPVR